MKNEQEVKSGAFTKAVQAKGRTIAFEVSDKGSIEIPKLEFTTYQLWRKHSARLTSNGLGQRPTIRFILG
jgi:hypothetical protein